MIYTILIGLTGGLVLWAAWEHPLGRRRLFLNALSIILLSIGSARIVGYFEHEWASIPRLPPHLPAHPLNIHPTEMLRVVYVAADLVAIYTLVRDCIRFKRQRCR